MKIAVLGGSGFIGKRFIELYGSEFKAVKILSSKSCPLDNYEKIKENTSNVEIVLHAAFDHEYKANISGIQNVLKACTENKVKKLVYLSTVSVYDSDTEGMLDENSPYSSYRDPYSKEKRAVEAEIEKGKTPDLDIIVLQPSIVYGLGGNWTKYAIHVSKTGRIRLPEKGRMKCNAVYVDDVADCIYKSCLSSLKYEKILISYPHTVSWEEFYKLHCRALTESGLPAQCTVDSTTNNNEYNPKVLFNTIFKLWYSTPLGNLINLLTAFLKKLRAKKYADTSSNETLKVFLKSDVTGGTAEPVGIARKVHNAKFSVDTAKAEKLLDFKARYGLEEAITTLQKDIERAVP